MPSASRRAGVYGLCNRAPWRREIVATFRSDILSTEIEIDAVATDSKNVPPELAADRVKLPCLTLRSIARARLVSGFTRCFGKRRQSAIQNDKRNGEQGEHVSDERT